MYNCRNVPVGTHLSVILLAIHTQQQQHRVTVLHTEPSHIPVASTQGMGKNWQEVKLEFSRQNFAYAKLKTNTPE